MTNQETKIFLGWKSEALKSFALGGSVATGLTWMGKYQTYISTNNFF